MELKLKFKQLRDAGGDACAPYEVLLNRECTLRELVDCILLDDQEWGYVRIGAWLDSKKLEYRYGKILSSEFTESEMQSTIETVRSNGGWTRMDYMVKLKEDKII